MQILLIDDNEKLCSLYQQLIMMGGHETRVLSNPVDAISAVHDTRPDLILLDIMMEPVTGWDVLEQIRKDETFSEIPVIILTGKILTAKEALKYGMMIEGYVMKPLEKNMLLAVINNFQSVLDESEMRYQRALSSGMNQDDAITCKNAVKKMKTLQFLTDTLTRQEQLLSTGGHENPDILAHLDDLRKMIGIEYQKIHKISEKCP